MTRAFDSERERYQRYLCSPEWNARRNAVLDRSCGRCEKCGREARHVHHLTYIRKYAEQLSDLQALCEECHDAIHRAKLCGNDELAVRRDVEKSGHGVVIDDPLIRFRSMRCVQEYKDRARRYGLIVEYEEAIRSFEQAIEGDDLVSAMNAKADMVQINRIIDGLEGFVVVGKVSEAVG